MVALTEGPVPGYSISDDVARFDVEAIHAFLTRAYWAEGRTIETVRRALAGSRAAVGVFDPEGRQVGLSRAISDGATFAWIADVYVLDGHRGRGLARWMLETLLAHPAVRDVRRFVLATRDAHTLYEGLGFVPLLQPERWMERPSADRPESPTTG